MKTARIKITDLSIIYCMGDNPPNDHPKIYIAVDTNTNQATCPYCQQKFIKKSNKD